MGVNASIGAENAVANRPPLAQAVADLSAAEIELLTQLREGSAQQARVAAARHLHALAAYLRAAATTGGATEQVPEQYRRQQPADDAAPAARARQTVKAG